ncbi:MAG: helix-turn-helix domain-containing protein [Thermoleophilaceae bacterium]
MTTEFDSRPYWKPRDLAALLDVSPSHVYRLIEDGELEHRRIGERAIRIPARAVAELLGEEVPVTSPTIDGPVADLAERADRFAERTGKRPEEFVVAWRDGRIEDTADNARDAIEALALREALAVTA